MLRAVALEGLRFRKEFEPAEDYDLWVRMGCELAVLDETLVRYRIHDRSASATKGEAMLRAVRAIHSGQLGRLGLSDKEDFHAATVAFDPISSFELFEGIEHWLCALKKANRDCGWHSPEIFDRELHNQWFAVAGRAYQLGLAGWRFWRQSPVRAATFASDIRLFARALRRELPRRGFRHASASEALSPLRADVNILLVNNQWRLGGAETVVHQLRRGFPSSRLAVADGKIFPPEARPLYPRVLARLSHSRLHSVVEHLAPRAGWSDRAFRRFADAACDLIHLHNFHGRYATIESLAHVARHKPLVWTFHALWGVTGGCDHPRECRRFLDACGECPQLGRWPLSTHDDTAAQLSAKHAQLAPLPLHVVAPSRWLADMVRASLVGRHWEVHHIPNAVDAEFCEALDRTPRKCQDTPAILIVNRNFRDEQKGFPILETALATVAAAQPNPRPRLILVGENSDWARDNFAGWSCESHGYVSDSATLARLHRSADIFLFASPAENFPCVILEAMAAGSCVVATPTGGVVEQVEDGVSGLLAADISGPALGAALVRALADSALRRRLGEAARNRAQRDFNEALFLERHRQLYSEVIQEWRARS
jgi:glycosyltransferase involved in cell wall biosynthesis